MQIYLINEKYSPFSRIYRPIHLEKIFQKLHRHTGEKWLIHGTKNHKDNQPETQTYHPGHTRPYNRAESWSGCCCPRILPR